ncbi:MAG: citrate synthase [Bacteroidales bacterium]|nr:citrate synthase [Bacteroidales bacterium]
MDNQELLTKLSILIKESCRLDKELFEKYDVKRGLRNRNHSGVLVGITNIGDVRGYRKNSETGHLDPIPGELRYRDIEVTKLVNGCKAAGMHGYEEVAYLLLAGELPNKEEHRVFTDYLAAKRDLTSSFTKNMILSLRGKDIMNMLARSVLALYTLDKDGDDTSRENLVKQSLNLIAKIPVIIAYAYHGMMNMYNRKELVIRHPNPDLTTAENFLYLLKGENNYTQTEADILDLSLILHADHGGGNNSTFTIRVTSSSGTDTYAAVAAAIASLKGPLHGGANLQVEEMMDDIRENVYDWEDEQEIYEYLMKILKKEAFNKSGKIYGMGHAVYTISDPRAILLRESAQRLAQEKGLEKEFALYTKVERLAQKAFYDYKTNTAKRVCANVDFYSGFVYNAIGIPKELFTPVFAMSRIVGWCAHRIEELNFDQKRIIRPAYMSVYTGPDYKPMDER